MASAPTVRARAFALRLEGHTYAAIASVIGLSRQRVQQLVGPPRRVRARIVERAKGRCQGCGIVTGRSGHVHHRGATGATADTYNDERNLVLLCVSCHTRAHGKEHRTAAARRGPQACACGCGARFTPSARHQRYARPSCRARAYLERRITAAAQTLLRSRS